MRGGDLALLQGVEEDECVRGQERFKHVLRLGSREAEDSRLIRIVIPNPSVNVFCKGNVVAGSCAGAFMADCRQKLQLECWIVRRRCRRRGGSG